MLSEKALESIARAIWDNHPQNQTPVNQLTGPILYELMRDDLLAVARVSVTAYLTALAEEGYVIVPREPTDEMERVGVHLRNIQDNSAFRNTAEIYRAMISKAEEPGQ